MPARTYDTIPAVPPTWLWPGRIPLRTVTVLVGTEGIGKGFFGADLTGRVTRNDDMPDGSHGDLSDPGSVLLVTREDDPNSAMAYRLRAARANLPQVIDFTDGSTINEEGIASLRQELDKIKRDRKRPNVRLIWIDPLSSVSGISLTVNNTRVRQKIIQPLEDIAREYDLAIVALVHTTKNGSVAGSKAITEAARMVLMFERIILTKGRAEENLPPEVADVRLIKVHKSNIGSDTLAPVGYTITGDWPDVHVEYLEIPDEAIAYSPGPVPLKDKIIKILADSRDQGMGSMQWRDIWQDLVHGRPSLEIEPDPELREGTVRTALSRLKADRHSGVEGLGHGRWGLSRDDRGIVGGQPLPRGVVDLTEYLGNTQ